MRTVLQQHSNDIYVGMMMVYTTIKTETEQEVNEHKPLTYKTQMGSNRNVQFIN